MREADTTCEAALERLLEQIELCDFRDKLGHRLTLNAAYIEAKALITLRRLLEGALRR